MDPRINFNKKPHRQISANHAGISQNLNYTQPLNTETSSMCYGYGHGYGAPIQNYPISFNPYSRTSLSSISYSSNFIPSGSHSSYPTYSVPANSSHQHCSNYFSNNSQFYSYISPQVGHYHTHNMPSNSTYTSNVPSLQHVHRFDQQSFGLQQHFAYQGVIYIIGGMNRVNSLIPSVSKFRPQTGSWNSITPMSSPRIDFACSIEKNRIYVFGGETTGEEVINTCEVFDIFTEKWKSISFMNTRRRCIDAATVNGKIYVCGGEYLRTALNTVEAYVPERELWIDVSSMQFQRSRLCCVSNQNTLYALGGQGHYRSSNSGEMCDVRTGKWVSIPSPLSRYRQFCATIYKEKIYTYCDEGFDMFDIISGRWISLPKPPKMLLHSQLVAFCNTILLIGGTQSLDCLTPMKSVYVYNPNERKWQEGEALSEAVSHHRTVVGFPELIY